MLDAKSAGPAEMNGVAMSVWVNLLPSSKYRGVHGFPRSETGKNN
jgi:hypothetical protein